MSELIAESDTERVYRKDDDTFVVVPALLCTVRMWLPSEVMSERVTDLWRNTIKQFWLITVEEWGGEPAPGDRTFRVEGENLFCEGAYWPGVQ